jgi:hypothetical protein
MMVIEAFPNVLTISSLHLIKVIFNVIQSLGVALTLQSLFHFPNQGLFPFFLKIFVLRDVAGLAEVAIIHKMIQPDLATY